MRKKMIMAMLAVCCVACNAKDIKTVVLKTSPEMHCANCENKIKSNIRFEKGIKDIVTSLEDKTVTIKYDADKTTVDNIIAGFAKIDYTATIATEEATATCCAEKKEAASCCGSSSCGCGSGTPCGASCESDDTAKVNAVTYFKAVQMNCGGCASKVQKTLEAVDGVNAVAVDLSTKSVKVEYDASKVDVEKLKDAFGTIQYASQLYYPGDDKVAYVSFLAEQMKCGGCAAKVKKNLFAEAGVKDVTVCLETKAVSIAYDSDVTSIDGLVDAFKKFDYDVVECYNKK